MKKSVKQFLLFAFAISYVCFGIMICFRTPFGEQMKQPLNMLLFTIGCLGPFLATLLVYHLNKEELGGLGGLLVQVMNFGNIRTGVITVLLFLLLHYGLAVMLSAVGAFGHVVNLLKFFPIMLVLFGLQEIGWRGLVQPGLAEDRGFWKATISTGLFVAIWFLPLLFIPGFIVHPDFYVQFAAYIVGMGLLQTTIYKQSKGILFCVLFSSLFFALSTVISLKQGNIIMAIVAVDLVIATAYNGKFFVK